MGHHRIFVNAHQSGPDALRLAASLGIGGVRVDGIWDDLMSAPGVFTFLWLDDLLATCQTLGLQVYVTFGYCPKYISLDRGRLPPLYDWQQFCRGVAEHFAGRLTYVGCWNEPQFPADVYVSRLLRPMREEFKRVDANYQICAPDLQTVGPWPTWLRDFFRDGGGSLIENLTVHAYADTADKVWSNLTKPRPRWIPSWSPWPTPSIQEVIEQSGWHGPTWLTETGWKSDELGEDGQAHEVRSLMERLLGSDWPAGVCLYQLLDERDPDHEPVSFGLFRADGTMKPAGAVMRRYTGRGTI